MKQRYEIPIDASGRETTRHGSPDFPLAVYCTDPAKNVLGFVDWHWHEELQWCLVTEGLVDFQIRDQIYRLAPGQALFINARCLHSAKPVSGTKGIYICVDFLPKLLRFFDASRLERKFVNPWSSDSAPQCLFIEGKEDFEKEITACLFDIHTAFDRHEYAFEYEASVLLARIWLLMIRHTKHNEEVPATQSKAQTERLIDIVEFLNSHLAHPIGMADVAARAQLSEGECCRFFKRMTGDTIFDYLQKARIGKASEALLKSSLTVADIAESCGFATASYFIEVFKKRVGMTPLQYRKSVQNEVRQKHKRSADAS